jgi:pentatricopeptide repeat domain-containing protein 3
MHHLRKTVTTIPFIGRRTSISAWRCSSSSTEGQEKIEIPNYIPRSPTAILKALSQTVGYDPTGSHFKYHDDPFLIPLSNTSRRTYALAMESGRKSAKWVRQQNSILFQVS